MSEAIVLILGMHRSGTSCLAGALNAAGLELGPVPRRGRHNARGNHELQTVSALNQDLLRSTGGGWSRPGDPAAPVPWILQRRLREVPALLRGLAGDSPAGIKDPLLLLVLDHWLREAGGTTLVGTFRHPIAVARSLQARMTISLDDALDAWMVYNDALIRAHRRAPFPLVEYDLADPARYLDSVDAVAGHIGLDSDRTAMAAFVSAELEHQRAPAPVPFLCEAAYEYLRANRMPP